MELINPRLVVDFLSNKVRNDLPYFTNPGLEDEKFANELFSLISNKFRNHAEVVEEATLDFGDVNESENISEEREELLSQPSSQSSAEEPESSSTTDQAPSSSDYSPEPTPLKRRKPGPPEKVETREKIARCVLDEGYSYAAVGRQFHKDPKLVKRIVEEYQGNLHYKEKIRKVKDYVKMSFENAREKGDIVHYWNLQNWASEAKRRIDVEFKISNTFLKNFKKDNNIVTRKITKYLTTREISNEAEIKRAGNEFVEKINIMVRDGGLNHDNVWNTDQSNFEYEMCTARTLSQKGEKDTWARCQSTNSLTHSYTIQVHISLSGKLGKSIYICFQERSGSFGPQVRASLDRNTPPNVFVDASTSGKLTKTHFKRWFQNVFSCDIPDKPNKSLLLLDSWSGQTDKSVSTLLPDKNITFEILPPKTTKYVQPLDVYFFRQYKPFIRRIENEIKAKENDSIKLNDRRFIMRMHSCVYNQFCSKQFENMILYAWKKSGYQVFKEFNSFDNALEIIFNTNMVECNIQDCENTSFLKCSYTSCQMCICLLHFLDENNPHLHDVE